MIYDLLSHNYYSLLLYDVGLELGLGLVITKNKFMDIQTS